MGERKVAQHLAQCKNNNPKWAIQTEFLVKLPSSIRQIPSGLLFLSSSGSDESGNPW